MGVKSLVGFVVAALAALVIGILTPSPSVPAEAAQQRIPEKPWLSRAAADQIVGSNGELGPLFTGVTLGGSPPSAEIRARIAAFARENDVKIDFEIADDELVAIRFDVTFGGCCGYEGVDVLAARIGQPKHTGGCGDPTYYYNNWAIAHEDGTHVRGAARVNRLSLRWERTLSFDELASRAEHVLGADRGTLAAAAGDRWIPLESAYLLEVAYPFASDDWQGRSRPSARGLVLAATHRIVTEVTFATNEDRARLRRRWGRPRVTGDGEWMWHRSDRTIVAVFDGSKTTVTLSSR